MNHARTNNPIALSFHPEGQRSFYTRSMEGWCSTNHLSLDTGNGSDTSVGADKSAPENPPHVQINLLNLIIAPTASAELAERVSILRPSGNPSHDQINLL